MKKYKYLILIPILGLGAWILMGRVSSSREPATSKALWGAVSSNDSKDAKSDSDKDGITSEEEKKLGTDPNKADSDGDGFLDGLEVKTGFDPLRAAPGDKILNGNSNSQNQAISNGNNNSGNNNTSISNTNVNAGNSNGNINVSLNNLPVKFVSGANSKNLTEEVMRKADELVAQYSLQTTSYNALNEDARIELEKNVNTFIEGLLKESGLDFTFNIPESNLRLVDTEDSASDRYLARAKQVLRENNLAEESQTIEDGIKSVILELSDMSKKDIDWDRTKILKKEIADVYQNLETMPVHPNTKNIHLRLLRVIRALGVSLDNIDSGDYFRSFLAAGRAEKINGELTKFTEEVKGKQ